VDSGHDFSSYSNISITIIASVAALAISVKVAAEYKRPSRVMVSGCDPREPTPLIQIKSGTKRATAQIKRGQ
jgi:hypothetical protein